MSGHAHVGRGAGFSPSSVVVFVDAPRITTRLVPQNEDPTKQLFSTARDSHDLVRTFTPPRPPALLLRQPVPPPQPVGQQTNVFVGLDSVESGRGRGSK